MLWETLEVGVKAGFGRFRALGDAWGHLRWSGAGVGVGLLWVESHDDRVGNRRGDGVGGKFLNE